MADETFPHNIKKLNENVHTKLRRHFKGKLNSYVEVGSQKWIFPEEYAKLAPIYYNFQVRPDDVWIVTFPRSGTLLTQEMTWLIDNDYDFDKAKNEPLVKRCPFLEFNINVTPNVLDECLENATDKGVKAFLNEKYDPVWKIISDKQEKRYIKTHIPFSLLPKHLISSGCKVIYVARNPKDVLVSNYHFDSSLKATNFVGTIEEYWDLFKNNLITYSPYFPHVKKGWELRNEKNVLFLFYEDLNDNKEETITKIANFLGKSTPTELQMKMLKEHLSIDSFKTNKAIFPFEKVEKAGLMKTTNKNFVRKGKSGGWRNEVPEKLNNEIDKWIEENLQDTDLQFRF